METRNQIPLRWPKGWVRTLINNRQKRSAWKKPFSYYREQVVKELQMLGATNVIISHNDAAKERLDPGVAVWFNVKQSEKMEWQEGLGLDDPLPTTDQIDDAYKKLARIHHPDAVDNGSGGDKAMFPIIQKWRQEALAWVRQSFTPELDNCIPCDKFTNTTENMAAIRMALGAFRKLEMVGIPAILERVMDKAFKALPSAKEVVQQ